MTINGVTYQYISKQLNIAFKNKCVTFSLDEYFASPNNERVTITPLKDVYKTSDVDFNFVSISGASIDGFFIVVNGSNKYFFTFDSNLLVADGYIINTTNDDEIVDFYNLLISKKS